MSFLKGFASVFHAVEAAAHIVAPVISIINPVVGTLLAQATNAAIGAEALITSNGAGQQRAELVKKQTQNTVDIINTILKAQGKTPLPADITDIVQQQVVTVVVPALNAISNAVTKDSTVGK